MLIHRSIGYGTLLCLLLIQVSGTEACGQDRVASSTGGAGEKHTLDPAIQVAESSMKSISALKDYQAVFSKREIVGNRMIADSMDVKIRHRPFSVYLRFRGENEGREVIYVDGQNEGQLLVHETGLTSLVGTISVNPTGNRAMSNSRYPITRIGMRNLVKGVLDQWKAERKFDDIELKYYPKAKLGNVVCKVIQTNHPRPRAGAKFYMTRLFIDRESNLPVRVEQYGFPTQRGGKPILMEEYTYSAVRKDLGMGNIDFDTRNPAYDF